MHGTARHCAALRCAFELRSHLITRYKKSPTLVRRAFLEIGAGDEIASALLMLCCFAGILLRIPDMMDCRDTRHVVVR